MITAGDCIQRRTALRRVSKHWRTPSWPQRVSARGAVGAAVAKFGKAIMTIRDVMGGMCVGEKE